MGVYVSDENSDQVISEGFIHVYIQSRVPTSFL